MSSSFTSWSDDQFYIVGGWWGYYYLGNALIQRQYSTTLRWRTLPGRICSSYCM